MKKKILKTIGLISALIITVFGLSACSDDMISAEYGVPHSEGW